MPRSGELGATTGLGSTTGLGAVIQPPVGGIDLVGGSGATGSVNSFVVQVGGIPEGGDLAPLIRAASGRIAVGWVSDASPNACSPPAARRRNRLARKGFFADR
jgi:hypothetical protein